LKLQDIPMPDLNSKGRRLLSRLASPIIALVILGSLLVACGYAIASSTTTGIRGIKGPHMYMYVWAGDVQRKQPDRLVTLNFDRFSPDYGKVIWSTLIPGAGGINNEPHHCGISDNLKVIACGGLLSVLRNQNGIFFFDISNPARPRFMFSTRASESSVTDAFVALPNNGFLVTQMGSATGGTPGRVVEVNGRDQIVHEWPDRPPTDGFNPHGISVRQDLDLMITSDFVDPASTLNVVPGAPVFRGSVRVWNMSKRAIIRTIHIPGAPGTMDCRLIPLDPQGRGYTAGVNNGMLYLLDTQHGTAQKVFDFNTIVPDASPQVMAASSDGRHLYVPIDDPHGGKVVDLDISDPAHPRLVQAIELGPGSDPHMAMMMVMGTVQKLIVSDYFLNEDGIGKVHADGDHKIHVFDVTEAGLRLDPRFEADFNTIIPGVQLRPHGILTNMPMPDGSD
jgi:56kDa selenium binding protein (SBP56)